MNEHMRTKKIWTESIYLDKSNSKFWRVPWHRVCRGANNDFLFGNKLGLHCSEVRGHVHTKILQIL